MSNIKGITVEIGGNTLGLQKALTEVNKETNKTTNELKQVERLLKLDPSNTELLAQKQKLLSSSVETTKTKLDALKKAKETADKEMAQGNEVNEAQYRKLQREIVATEDSLKGLEEQLKKSNPQLEAFGNKAKEVGENLSNVGDKLTKNVSLPIAAAEAGLVAIGSVFDDVFDDIRVGTGATGEALEELYEDFRKVAENTPASLGDIGKAIADYNTRLGLTGEALQNLSRQTLELSRLTKSDLNTVIEESSQAFQAFNLPAEQYGNALDYIFKVSQSTGIQITRLEQNMVKFAPAMKQLGLNFEEAATLMGQLDKTGVDVEQMLAGLTKSVATMAKEGITDANQAIQILFDRIKNAPSDIKGTEAALKIFGNRAGPAMASAIREGKLEFQDLLTELKGSSETILGVADETKDFAELFIELKNNLMLALEPLGGALFNAINDLMPLIQGLVGFITKLVQGFADLSPTAQKVILIIFGVIAAIGPLLSIIGTLISLTGSLSLAVGALGISMQAALGWIGLVVVAVTAIVAALATWITTSQSASAEAVNLRKETEQLTESYNENIEAIEKSEAQDLAKMEVAKDLTNELYTLDEQVKNGTLSENESTDAKKRMHSIADQLRKLMPDLKLEFDKITGALITERGEVEKLIDSYIRLAKVKAAEKKLIEAQEKVIEAEVLKKEAESGLYGAKYNLDYYEEQKKGTVISGRRALTKEEMDNIYGVNESKKAISEYEKAISSADISINTFNKDVQILEQIIKEAGGEIANSSTQTENLTNQTKTLGTTQTETAKGGAKAAKSTANTEKELTKELEKERDKRFKDLKYNLDMGKITEEGYYEGLKTLRDTYFEEGSEEWQKYTLDIANYHNSVLDKLKSNAEQRISELMQLQEQMEAKLKGYGESLFSEISITQDGKTRTFTQLTDFSKDIRELERYRDAIIAVQERGASAEFMSIMKGMGVEEGTLFAEALLKSSDDNFDKYLASWQKKQDTAVEITSKLYENETTTLKTSIIDELNNAIQTIPQEFLNQGILSAEMFGEGFFSRIGSVMSQFKGFPNLPGTNTAYASNSTNINFNQTVTTTANTPADVSRATKNGLKAMEMAGVFG